MIGNSYFCDWARLWPPVIELWNIVCFNQRTKRKHGQVLPWNTSSLQPKLHMRFTKWDENRILDFRIQVRVQEVRLHEGRSHFFLKNNNFLKMTRDSEAVINFQNEIIHRSTEKLAISVGFAINTTETWFETTFSTTSIADIDEMTNFLMHRNSSTSFWATYNIYNFACMVVCQRVSMVRKTEDLLSPYPIRRSDNLMNDWVGHFSRSTSCKKADGKFSLIDTRF